MTRKLSSTLPILLALARGAHAQLAVGEISGSLAPANTIFHGYVALLDFGASRFDSVVRNPPACNPPQAGFAPLVTTTEWAKQAGVFLAVNGSFSLPELEYKPGDCLQMIGPIKSFGRLIAGSVTRPDGAGNPALLFSPVNIPSIVMTTAASIAAASNVVSGQWQDCQTIGPGCQAIPRNGSLLVQGGQNMGATAEPVFDQVTSRTAAGLTKDSILVLVVIEGGLPGYSDGIDLLNLADLLIAFGAVSAVNFDGGGSSTMVYNPSTTTPIAESLRLYAPMKAAQSRNPNGLTFQFTQRNPNLAFTSRPTEKLGGGNHLYRAIVSHFGFRPIPGRR